MVSSVKTWTNSKTFKIQFKNKKLLDTFIYADTQ